MRSRYGGHGGGRNCRWLAQMKGRLSVCLLCSAFIGAAGVIWTAKCTERSRGVNRFSPDALGLCPIQWTAPGRCNRRVNLLLEVIEVTEAVSPRLMERAMTTQGDDDMIAGKGCRRSAASRRRSAEVHQLLIFQGEPVIHVYPMASSP